VTHYLLYANAYLLTCDHCGRHDSFRTAKTEGQARHIAMSLFGWSTNTSHGDFCPYCASLLRNGVLD
jgi:hypothetical protein